MKKLLPFLVISTVLLAACQTSPVNSRPVAQDSAQKASSTSSVSLKVVDQNQPNTTDVKNTTIEVDGLKIEGVMDVSSVEKSQQR